MTKTICYDEFCGTDAKIHFLNWVLLGLVAAAIIAAIVAADSLFIEATVQNILSIPIEF